MVSFLLKRPPGFEDLVQEERDQQGHNRDDREIEEPRTCVKMLRVCSHVQEDRNCSDMPVVVQAFHYDLLNEKEEQGLPFQIYLHDDPSERGECRQSVERTKDS